MQRNVLKQISTLASMDSLISGAILCTIATSLQRVEYRQENVVAAITIKDATLRRLRARLACTKSSSQLTESLGLAAYAVSLLLWVEVCHNFHYCHHVDESPKCVEGNVVEAEAHLSGLEHLVGRVEPTSIPPSLMANIIR